MRYSGSRIKAEVLRNSFSFNKVGVAYGGWITLMIIHGNTIQLDFDHDQQMNRAYFDERKEGFLSSASRVVSSSLSCVTRFRSRVG